MERGRGYTKEKGGGGGGKSSCNLQYPYNKTKAHIAK